MNIGNYTERGAENLWFCMTCGEFLKEHPQTIESLCFEHMCDDLHPPNIKERMDKVIRIIELAQSSLQASAVEPTSIWKRIKEAVTKRSSILDAGFMLLVLVGIASMDSDDRCTTTPYESNMWLLLQSFGTMIDVPRLPHH